MPKPCVSAIIAARNEARQIADCIGSVRDVADEIIVVNDRSEDDTAVIAARLGARIIDADSRDSSIEALNKIGFEAATGEWLLRMDADERMAPTLAQKLLEVAETGTYSAVCFARKNFLFGGWARYGGWFKSHHRHFLRADSWDRSWWCIPHSSPAVKGSILTLPAREDLATIHYDYDSVAQFVRRTLLGYAETEARYLFGAGVRFSPLRLVFKPAKRFLGRYFIRQGWRDGWRGLVLAGLLAAYDFCIEANLWDLERRQGK